jgi:AIG2 family protein
MARRNILLFQYGSNMEPKRLNSPDRLAGIARVIGVARLDHWGIRFDLYSSVANHCGVTDIVSTAREHVLGVLYKVPYRSVVALRGQRSRMDVIEGARRGRLGNYKRQKILVRRNGQNVEARTYVGTALGRKRFLRRSSEDRRVSEAYLSHLLAGALRFKFPKSYMTYLRRQAGALKSAQRRNNAGVV